MALGQVKTNKLNDEYNSSEKNFVSKSKLNVNDLLQRRKDEKAADKKVNLFIVTGVTTVAAVLLVIFSL